MTLLDIDEGDGQARYEPDDQDLLFEIAAFMDQHPARYPPPAPPDAERWTWTERIARGTALDAHETRLFQLALEELRSEEHTSELQSLMRISYAVFCLKKKTKT